VSFSKGDYTKYQESAARARSTVCRLVPSLWAMAEMLARLPAHRALLFLLLVKSAWSAQHLALRFGSLDA